MTEPWTNLAEYVTAPFAARELELVDATVQRAAEAVGVAVREGLETAMNRYNRSG